ALAAALICYRRRSATRDIGKALRLPEADITRLLKGERPPESRRLALFDALLPQLLGVPRHLSQHVGGFVITRAPVATLVPVENAAMPGRTIIQWGKDDLEAMGLLKIDILALGMLTAIRKTLALVNAGLGHGPLATGQPHDRDATRPLTMADIPPEDAATYAMLRHGDSVGVFQVESRAQMAMLPRLKPRTFYDLVVQVAIVRPGPIQGGMVHPYLRRRAGEEPVDYPSVAVKDVLERTLGVPIFQEQVIKLAMVAAGFSAGEADQLRRAMAAWKRSGELEKFRGKLIDGMLARGYTPDFAERLFRQIEGFGEYGFPESHAASFALLVYVSAWLKRHHPAAFLCGLLNSLPMGFYSPSQLVQDAQRHDVRIHQTDVLHSDWDCTLQQDAGADSPALRLGLRLVDGFGSAAAQRLMLARAQRPFGNLQDLKARAALARDELDALIAANATAGFSGHRRQAHWEAGAIENTRPLYAAQEQADPAHLADGLFLLPAGERENLLADYAATGLTLGRHPLALLRPTPPFNRCRRAAELATLSSGRFVRVAGVVTNRQRPGTASGVLFVTLEDETGNVNLVVWKNVQERCRRALLDARILLVKGTVEAKDGVVHVMAGTVEDVSAALSGFAAPSRDFR
ncbi:MAG: OB-fold nucleic acid binding domain-containing protein, partial [Gammaproteobacteria bacterium]